jgi:hypothetical protein
VRAGGVPAVLAFHGGKGGFGIAGTATAFATTTGVVGDGLVWRRVGGVWIFGWIVGGILGRIGLFAGIIRVVKAWRHGDSLLSDLGKPG